MTTTTMNKNKIKRNDFVTLNVDIPSAYGDSVTKAGTKCRVWKAKRDGTVCMSPEDGYHLLTVNVNCVTRIDGPKAEAKVGDIYVCSWGYEQTNIDYYQVVRVLPKSVVVQSIDSIVATMVRCMARVFRLSTSFVVRSVRFAFVWMALVRLRLG